MSTVKSSVTLLTEMIEPTVEALGLELWGVEHIQQGRYSLLRIYIEREQGITIEDCANVSRQVGAVLDVEDPITSEYTLEVSSPGLDRPLFTARQFEQFVGSEVSLRLHSAVQGRRKFKGGIARVDGDSICLQVDGSDFELRHADIEKASIVYED
ncbi:MAG: ribosome maturation factor RimP [Pseudohongiellaceae bacterium]